MNRNLVGAAVAMPLLVLSLGCQSHTATPVAPTTTSTGLNDGAGAGPGGTALKAGVPVAQSPINNVLLTSLTPTLVVSGGGLSYSGAPIQYRFRVIDDTGATAIESGSLTGTSWTLPAPLTPTSKYTWIARSEYQGLVGAWSSAASFTTPVAPGNDYGAWESSCQGISDRLALVTCVWSFVRPANSYGDLEVVKRVAWLLRGAGGGLLKKDSGENTVPWLGISFSASRVCFPDGHIYKIIGDAGPGGNNTPGWADNDLVDPSLYVAAIDPRLR